MADRKDSRQYRVFDAELLNPQELSWLTVQKTVKKVFRETSLVSVDETDGR